MFSSSKNDSPLLVSGFGSAVIDVLMMASNPIALQKKNLIERQVIQIGGVIPTALSVLARLGVQTELHTLLGGDTFGEILTALLKQEGIRIHNAIIKPDMITPLACVTIHKDNGQRTSFYTTGDFSTSTDPTLIGSLNPNAQYLIADGHNNALTRRSIQKAKANNTIVMLDLGNPKPGLEELAYMSDGIIIPRAYWSTLPEQNPEVIVRDFLSHGPSLVVLTMEERGCIIGTHDTLFHQNSFHVDVIDTNGAGDVFFGSFMYGLTQQWELKRVAEFASAAASRSCSIFGKEQKLPHSQKEITDFIQTHSHILY